MRSMSKKSKFIVAGAVVASMAFSGVAYAYWTTTGSGTGSAATTDGTADLTVTQLSAPSNMAPGVAAGTISVSVTNNAPNNARVAQVVASIASVSGGLGACSAADYTLANPIMTNGAADLATTVSATFSGATLGFNNTAANQDGCKGATVNLAYAAS